MPNLGYSAVLKPGEGVVVVIEGHSYPVPPDALNYVTLVDALRDQAPLETIRDFVTPKQALISTAAKEGFEVVIDEATDNVMVFCDGHELKGLVADRIIDLVRAKQGFEVLQRFVQKAIKNRDPDAIDDLYTFIDHNGCTLHPDGDILCFKAVRQDYRDHHTGQVDYTLGTRVWKRREDCDPNPRRDCSNGLHVGGRKYVENFHRSGSRILIVKVNPADWVAVPEYDHGKARVCDLYVYAEIPRTEMDSALTTFVEVIDAGERMLKKPAPTFDATKARAHETTELANTKLRDGDDTTPVRKAVKYLKHAASGKRVALQTLLKLVEKFGQRHASRTLGIPRTTIQDWIAQYAPKG